jgi:hypothetical protein
MAGSGSTPAFEWRQAGADEYDEKGDKHLRTLFIHGARAVVRVATNNNDRHMNQWVNQLRNGADLIKRPWRSLTKTRE